MSSRCKDVFQGLYILKIHQGTAMNLLWNLQHLETAHLSFKAKLNLSSKADTSKTVWNQILKALLENVLIWLFWNKMLQTKIQKR